MDQQWFEMTDIRRRRFDGAVWIPLREQWEDQVGEYRHAGLREECLSIATLAVPAEARDRVDDLTVSNLATNGWGYYGAVEDSVCEEADVYDHFGRFSGVHLVLEQNFNGLEDPREWYLHQDLVLTLGLKREQDVWVRPAEGYETVLRETRVDGRSNLIQVRSGHLKDYLCAREIGLVVVTYRSRKAVLSRHGGISWAADGTEETDGGDRWLGRVAEIHEGGRPYREKTAVFHVARTDVDADDDVPVMGRPSDDNVSSRSWRRRDRGRKLYRVSGELWRTEWIPAGANSPIVRNDGVPTTESFIVDAEGNEERGSGLGAEGRWLWFRPELVTTIAHRRRGHLGCYTRETGTLGCSGYGVHFGVNRSGLVTAYAEDVAELPRWLQRAWSGHNVRPEGGVSEELLTS